MECDALRMEKGLLLQYYLTSLSKLSVFCYLDPPYEYSIGVAVRWLMVVLASPRNEFRYLVLSKKTTRQLILSYFIASECTNEVLALPYILKLMKGDSWRLAVDNLVKGLKLQLKVEKLTGSCCNVIYLSLSPNSRMKINKTILSGSSDVLDLYHSLQFNMMAMHILICYASLQRWGLFGVLMQEELSAKTVVTSLFAQACGSLNETEIPRVGILNDTKCAGYVPLSNNILTK
ncbi:hypothetical protein CISIN_1g046760mg [Citrus sinensis]|uniref:Uncharacterized protein n=1 Tax=Citrus sinensis TaxID=2711 RepID=A0A067EKS5_CITSI|nr:hypothetical protein CISIN_1g046760mg [Citrus sinensis]